MKMFDILQLGEVDGFLGQDRLVVTPDGVWRGIDRPGSGHDKERSGRLEHILFLVGLSVHWELLW